MSNQTEQNLALAEQWAQYFNVDVERLVTELYSPDCVFSGASFSQEKLLRFERRVLSAAPNRSIRVDKTHAVDDVVTVEGVLLDPDQGADWTLPFCAVLTWRDGKVVSDNTYAEMSRWPGVR
jgi:SnoaL-like domain